MAKPKRTEAELIALLNAALRRTDVCDSVNVAAICQVEDKTANWDADALRGSGVAVRPDCKRVFIAAKYYLRQKYDLLMYASIIHHHLPEMRPCRHRADASKQRLVGAVVPGELHQN